MLKSFKSKLFAAFTSIAAITCLALFINSYFLHSWEELSSAMRSIQRSRGSLIEAQLSLNLFLNDEVKDTSFYANQSSSTLRIFREEMDSVEFWIQEIQLLDVTKDLEVESAASALLVKSGQLRELVDEVEKRLLERGFWDFGVEGRMRDLAHQLEERKGLDQVDVLMLRRHEKDFQLRLDVKYLTKFGDRVKTILEKEQGKRDFDETKSLLHAYQREFFRLATLEGAIGLHNSTGFVAKTRQSAEELNILSGWIIESATEREARLFANMRQVWFGTLTVTILLVIILSLVLSRLLTKGIDRVSESLHRAVSSEFADLSVDESNQQKGEIGKLAANVSTLKVKLAEVLSDIKLERNRALEADKAKSRFLANMSHEIRTPLNGITGMNQLLHTTELTAQQKHYLSTIQFCSTNLMGIINDILDYSKIEANKLEIESVEFDLDASLTGLNQMMNTFARNKGIAFKYQPDENNTLSRVIGDELRVQQVLINFTNNAIKFTEEGEVCLTVRSELKDENQLGVHFEISDTGIGMSEDQIDKLFTPFEQADSSTTRKFGGTGLGLSIAHDLVERMKGAIECTSELNVGTKFTIFLPFEIASVATKKKGNSIENVSFDGKKVLVAEDNLVNQQVIQFMLEQTGLAVTMTNDGQQAVDAFDKAEFDLVLLDLQMPVKDGIQAATEMIAKRTGQNDPLIMALTANALESEKEKCLALGMDGFLTKPLQEQDLLQTLKKIWN